MPDLRDIAQQRDIRMETKEDKPPRFRGEIVEQRDARTGIDSVYVAGRPLMVWVKLWSAEGNILPAWNDRGVPAVKGMPVYVTRKQGTENELEIVGVDKEVAENTDMFEEFSMIGQHANQHEWPDRRPGFQPVTVYPRAFSMLRTYTADPPSLSVRVSAHRYWYGNTSKSFGGGLVDLTAAVPAAAGQARLVLIYLDISNDTLGSTNGTIGLGAAGWSALPRPALTAGTIPSAFVRLEFGQTTINEDDILDARDVLNEAGKSGWPFDNMIKVDPTNPSADYDTVADAIAAPPAVGDEIVFGPATYTCDGETLPTGVNMASVSQDKEGTILQTSTNQSCLIVAGTSLIDHLTIKNTYNVAGSNIRAITINAGSNLELRDCYLYANNANVSNAYAYALYAQDDVKIVDCFLEALTGYNSLTSAIYVTNGAVVHVYGGVLEGEDYDIIVYNGELHLHGTVLVNGTILTYANGAVYGEYWDQTKAKLIDLSSLGEQVVSDEDVLLHTLFDRWEQPAGLTGANRRNAILGSRGEHLWVGAAADDYDDRGPLVWVPGRLPGTRALRIEPLGTNYIVNPLHRDDNGDNIADYWTYWDNFGSGGSATPTIVDNPDKRKGWLQRYQYTAAPGDVNGLGVHYEDTGAATFAAGEDCTFSCVIKVDDLTGCTMQLTIQALNNVGVSQGAASLTITNDVDSTLRGFSVTYANLPATTDHVRVLVYVQNVDNGDSYDIYVGEANVEKLDCATSLIWGGAGDGFWWSGVPHASTSGRRASYVMLDGHTDLISQNNTVTYHFVVRAPYDADATWPNGYGNYVFDARGADSNNRVILNFADTIDKWTVYLNGVWYETGPVQTFKAGAWFHLDLVCDYTNDSYRLYVNGELNMALTPSLTAPTLTDWCIGANYAAGGASKSGWIFDEAGVIDRVLTPAEVNALYIGGLPILDPRSMALDRRATVPGVSAGRWMFFTSSIIIINVYTELFQRNDAVGGSRLTFAGAWVTGLPFFEVSINCTNTGTTGYAKLQWYDVATANWRDVPDGVLSRGGVLGHDRMRTGPLTLPLQETEYRVMGYSADDVNAVYFGNAAIVVMPCGEDNI